MGRHRVLGACSVDGCGRDAIAKNLCSLHYQRAHHHRNIDAPVRSRSERAGKSCSIEQCGSETFAAGLCKLHYFRRREGRDMHAPVQAHRDPIAGAPRVGGPCVVRGCGLPVAAQGMCWGHYRRRLRGVAVDVVLEKPEGAKHARAVQYGCRNASYSVRRMALFDWYLREGLVTPEPNTGCLLWLGHYNEATGYPVLGHAQSVTQRDPWGQYAHRAALHFSGVSLASGTRKLHARHSCNNPGCVAADFNAPVSAHVFYGTAKENMADRTERYARGEIKRVGRRGTRQQIGRASCRERV